MSIVIFMSMTHMTCFVIM